MFLVHCILCKMVNSYINRICARIENVSVSSYILQICAEATLVFPLLVAETFAGRQKEFGSIEDKKADECTDKG